MHLRKKEHILKIWRHALAEENNLLILMRHGPKSGGNDTGLSRRGTTVVRKYGEILWNFWTELGRFGLFYTDKPRTYQTLCNLFPEAVIQGEARLCSEDLFSPPISEELQKRINRIHEEIGRWRGYSLNQTYAFFKSLGGEFPNVEEQIGLVAVKAATGIYQLSNQKPAIFCGHSPSLELGIAHLLKTDILELGGFLNPLDSIFLRAGDDGSFSFIARINPIIGCVDAESEMYLSK